MTESKWNSSLPGSLLRRLPTVNELLETPRLRGLVERVNQNVLVSGARGVLDELRTEIQSTSSHRTLPALAELAERIARRIVLGSSNVARPVINATGELFVPALGGAPLSAAAIEAIVQAARDYSSAGVELSTGQPVAADAELLAALRERTGADAALVMASAAAGLLTCLAALARGREVIIARGQMAEVEGGTRIADLIESADATLREVGATNRATLDDYRAAINDRTAVILVAQSGDYRIAGQSEQPGLESLAALAGERRLTLVEWLGAALLAPLEAPACGELPSAAESLRAGADVVVLSGEGHVGGPRSGIVVGRREPLRRIAEHPLAAVCAADRLTRSALAETVAAHHDGVRLSGELPLWQLATTSAENLRQRAQRLAPQMAASPRLAAAEAREGTARFAAGSEAALPSWTIELRPKQGTAEKLAAELRTGRVAVIGRVAAEGVVVLDLRSVFPRQDVVLVDAVVALGAAGETPLPEAEGDAAPPPT